MAWTIEYTNTARRNLKRLDKQTAQRIIDYMFTRIATADNPRQQGKPLTGSRSGSWRYRVGDYRIVCKILDNRICVLVLDIGHRSDVYRRKK